MNVPEPLENPVWKPSVARSESSNIQQFIRYLRKKEKAIDDYWELHSWSIANAEEFWTELWDYYSVIGDRVGNTVNYGDQVEKAEWFPDSQLNFTENLLRHNSSKTALIEIGQNGVRREMSYGDLCQQVQSVAQYLISKDVKGGDVVAGVMDNSIPTVVGCLAAAQIGAAWTACSFEFGLEAIVERLGQVSPKILFTVRPSGTTSSSTTDEKLKNICRRLPSIVEVVICNGDAEGSPITPSCTLVDYQRILTEAGYKEYPRLPFNQLLYILYSSGTTGKPKCILHGAGGTLLQHVKELGLHVGLRTDDTIFFYTSCGWMMWNWLISSLFFGATVVLYSGSPIFPRPQRLFDICIAERVKILGVSPRYLQACLKASVEYDLKDGLPNLKTLLSTGSVLQPYLYDYVYENIKEDILVSSISGGSDIISCFCLGSEMLPVYKGESQTTGLGMDVASYSDDGSPCILGKGELVCRNAFPSRPLGFWGDSDNKKFHQAYFKRFPNVWTHGDFIEITVNKGIVFHGRSDATLNVGGVRIGTGEIYKQVSKIPEVVEAVAVEQLWSGDSRMLLFLKLAEGCQLDKELQRNIRKVIRENLSEDHVPNRIISVPDLPRTYSGKTVELTIKAIVNKQEIKNIEAIENPESLDYFRTVADIQR